jgi:hypothetical protein
VQAQPQQPQQPAPIADVHIPNTLLEVEEQRMRRKALLPFDAEQTVVRACVLLLAHKHTCTCTCTSTFCSILGKSVIVCGQ